MAADYVKILVSGDVLGRFKLLFEKVQKINNEKGPFEYLFCVGSFFGTNNSEWSQVLSGDIFVPVDTYVLGPIEHDHTKYFRAFKPLLGPKIRYLGREGVMAEPCGLKVAYLSGIERKTMGCGFFKHNIEDVVKSAASLNIDILLTSQWPEGIKSHARDSGESTSTANFESKMIANLVQKLTPRYHFAAFRGLQYKNLQSKNFISIETSSSRPTKFIGLAAVGNRQQWKSFYAFKMKLFNENDADQVSSTAGPERPFPKQRIYSPMRPRYRIEDDRDAPTSTAVTESRPMQFFFDMRPSTSRQKRPASTTWVFEDPPKKQATAGSERDSCWFCLKNKNAEKHLIVKVGEHVYLALAKGCLVTNHTIIVPIDHIKSLVSLPEPVEDEMDKYKRALMEYYDDIGKAVIFFERNVNMHTNLQALPIPKPRGGAVKNTVFRIAGKMKCEIEEISCHSSLKEVVSPGTNYFYLECVVGKKPIFKGVNKGQIPPVLFARTVMVQEEILDIPKQIIDWTSCEYSRDEEEMWVEDLKKKFEKYAP